MRELHTAAAVASGHFDVRETKIPDRFQRRQQVRVVRHDDADVESTLISAMPGCR
jgi:hypothetical protein